jgi:type II secretion system protein I
MTYIADPSWVEVRPRFRKICTLTAPLHSGRDGRAIYRGFSLLEIILALAILAGALAALGEVMRLADQNAALARDETQAEVLANSVMAELLCGARPMSAVNNAAFEIAAEPPWTYSVAIDATEYQELVAVRVNVAQQLPPELQPAQCTLVRWVLNPDFVNAEIAEQDAAAEEAANAQSNANRNRDNTQQDDDDQGSGFGGDGGQGGGGGGGGRGGGGPQQ